MNWGDVILEIETVVEPLTTATTGVDDDSELIAVCIGGDLYCRKVPQEKLLPSMQYHGFDANRLIEFGAMDDDAFKEEVAHVLENKLLATYNPAFQAKYLAPYVDIEMQAFDLPMVYKGALTHMAIEEMGGNAEYISALMKLAKGRVGFKSFCEKLGVVCHDAALLPLEQNCWQLSEIWKLFLKEPATILEK